jgi:hypothetical protein
MISSVVASLGVLAWFLMFSYANWLKTISPTSPDSGTGQVVYEKAMNGVFYITPEQAFWVQGLIMPIWLVLAASIGVGILAKPPKGSEVSRASRILGMAWSVVLLAVLFFGDKLLAPLFNAFPASAL